MRVVCVTFLRGVVGDIEHLTLQIGGIDDPVCVVSVLPDLARNLFARGKGEAAFDELSAAFDGFVWRGCQQDVDVVGHYHEGMQFEFARIAVAEEGGDEEFGENIPLEETAALVSDGGERVGLWLQAHRERHVPGG